MIGEVPRSVLDRSRGHELRAAFAPQQRVLHALFLTEDARSRIEAAMSEPRVRCHGSCDVWPVRVIDDSFALVWSLYDHSIVSLDSV